MDQQSEEAMENEQQKEWITIASAGDDMIDGEILDWCGCGELWNEHELGEDSTLVSLLEERCPSASVFAESYDYGMPGDSGVEYRVETQDPERLRTEIREMIEELIEEKREAEGNQEA